MSEIIKNLSDYSFYSLNSVQLQNIYQKKYNGPDEMALFKVDFNSLIKNFEQKHLLSNVIFVLIYIL